MNSQAAAKAGGDVCDLLTWPMPTAQPPGEPLQQEEEPRQHWGALTTGEATAAGEGPGTGLSTAAAAA